MADTQVPNVKIDAIHPHDSATSIALSDGKVIHIQPGVAQYSEKYALMLTAKSTDSSVTIWYKVGDDGQKYLTGVKW